MPVVLVASDKFKGTLTAAEVAAAVARRAYAGSPPDAAVDSVPVADGGDGTLAAAVAAGFELVPVAAAGPTGEPVATGYARQGDVAVVEMADVSGLVRLPGGEPAPMTATSRGVGELVAAAVDRRLPPGRARHRRQRQHRRRRRHAGRPRRPAARRRGGRGRRRWRRAGPESLGRPGRPARERMAGVEVVVACDVDNPLTGPTGAAAVYGPQKGADPDQVARAGRRARPLGGRSWPRRPAATCATQPVPVPPAASASPRWPSLGAELRPGIDLVLDLVGFREQLAGADLVITGEGALDEQTLHGKAPAGVAAAARAAGVPVVAVCGRNTLTDEQLRGGRHRRRLRTHRPRARRAALHRRPRPLLERLGERIAADHLSAATLE